MKRRELEKILKEQGYWLIRSNKHFIWTNGIKSIPVPNQLNINKMLCRQIFKEMEYAIKDV